MTFTTLPVAECWDLLSRTAIGRLAVDLAGRPEIFPINYVTDGDTIVFRTGAGTKLAGAALTHHVALEIDGQNADEHTVWSVIVKGWAEPIERLQEVYDAELLPLVPWVESDKPNFVRIRVDQVTGRRFHLGTGAVLDGSLGEASTADSA